MSDCSAGSLALIPPYACAGDAGARTVAKRGRSPKITTIKTT